MKFGLCPCPALQRSDSTSPGPSVGGGGPGYVATALIAIAIAYSVGGSRVIVATKGTDRWHQKIRGYYRHRFAGGRSHSVKVM